MPHDVAARLVLGGRLLEEVFGFRAGGRLALLAITGGPCTGRHPDIGRAAGAGGLAWAAVVAIILAAALCAKFPGGLGAELASRLVAALGIQPSERLFATVFRLAGSLVETRLAFRRIALCPFGLHRPLRRVVFLVFNGRIIDRRVKIGAGLFDQTRSELVAQHAAAHFQHLAFGEIAELERTVGNADQAVDLEAECAEHVLDLAVLAFTQAHADPDVVTLGTVERRVDCAIKHAIDGNAFLQLVERCLIDLAMGAHAVTAQPAGGRQFQHAGKTAIIGEQQQAFGIDIEAADGQNARQFARQIVENGRAAFRVGIGRHQTGGLVIEPQARALGTANRHAVDFDLVGQRGVDDRCIQLDAVQRHAAFHDHALDIAARGHTCARHDLGNALGLGAANGFRRRGGLCLGRFLFALCGGLAGAFRLLVAANCLAAVTLRLVFKSHLLFACCLGCPIRSKHKG
ncbi:hypothetical protein D3C87_887010 [compost metagenome]